MCVPPSLFPKNIQYVYGQQSVCLHGQQYSDFNMIKNLPCKQMFSITLIWLKSNSI